MLTLRTTGTIGASLVLLVAVLAAGAGAGVASLLGGGDSAPSATATSEIPAAMLTLYEQAAASCPGLPWSVLAAIGGLMEAGRVSAVTGQQGYGEGIIFTVFAAAVIGGVSLAGGKGNMVGAATGVVLLSLVQNILDLANVSSYWILAIDGAVILLALAVARMIGGKTSQG